MGKQLDRMHSQTGGRLLRARSVILALTLLLALPLAAMADTAADIDRDANIALDKLYRSTPAAKKISKISKGVLVFPNIIQGGFVIGGQYGEGVLRVRGKSVGYYNTVAASFGLQIGAESFGYALFFLDDDSLQYMRNSAGWEIGVGPTVTIVDAGMAASLSTTTAQSGIYAFFFNQKGLMAGVKIEGSKISKITPDKK